jgi:hypothetical protein
MSFLRLLPQISVHPIEPRGFDESFLAKQFVDRLKTRLAEMQRDLAEHEQLDVVAFSPFRSSHFRGSRGLCQSGTRHTSRPGAGEREGLHVAGSSIIDTGLGLDRIDSLRFSKEGGDL